MSHLYFFIFLITSIVIGMLIGSINTSRIIAKIFKINILNLGSKNPGATNLARVSKISLGVIAALLDLFKIIIAGYIFYLITYYSHNEIKKTIIGLPLNDFTYKLSYLIYLTPAVGVIAHCYPVYSGFKKGGKGTASFVGFAFFVSPYVGLVFFLLWWTIELITKYVSLASLTSALITTIFYWINRLRYFYWLSDVSPSFFFIRDFVDHSLVTFVFVILLFLTLMIFWRHNQNIVRLLNKKESKFYFNKKYKI